MQWLIDIIKEWIIAQGYLTTSFIDRGDPVIWDYGTGDFTPDDAWHELDLSSLVPEGAKEVSLRVVIEHSAVDKVLYFRKHGNVASNNIGGARTQVSMVIFEADTNVALDENRKIDYHLNSPAWIIVHLTVKGWWF